MRLLVVEDDVSLCAALTALFERRGAQVETAGDPAAARATVERWLPDAILCDVAMPGEDGYAFLRKLRACDPPLRDVPVIGFSAIDHDLHDAIERFDAYVRKTADFDQLVAVIQQVIGARR